MTKAAPENLDNVDLEKLAIAIVKVAGSFEELKKSPLKLSTIAVLIKAMPGMSLIPLKDIKIVLENASNLESFHIQEKVALKRLGD